MSARALPKVPAATAAEICAHFTVPDEARALLGERTAPGEFITALLAKKQYVAAIDFVAHALPPREAVWWGCLCVQHACGATLSPGERAACTAAVQWVLEPTEPNRVATKGPADAIGLASPAGAVAAAALQTGGNLAPPKAPPKPPPPFAPAKAVAGAVKLASIKSDPVRIAETQRLYVELGVGIAEGRVVWPEGATRARGRN